MTTLEEINKKLEKKFGQNLYFREIRLFDTFSNGDIYLEFNNIKPALARLSKVKSNFNLQAEREDKLRERVEKFLDRFGVEFKELFINY